LAKSAWQGSLASSLLCVEAQVGQGKWRRIESKGNIGVYNKQHEEK
jgi:hypothetical protein